MELIFCLIPLGLIVFIIWVSSSRSKSPQQNNVLNRTLLIKWLYQMKGKGFNTIDELIESLQPTAKKITTEPINTYKETKYDRQIKNESETAAIREKPPQQIPDKPELVYKPTIQSNTKEPSFDLSRQLSNANFLLYLGSGLVLFAIFVFTAFNWQNFLPSQKTLIIILLTLGFYVSAFFCGKNSKLKQASNSFYFIGSVCLGFAGIGIWNFNESLFKSIQVTFSTYWLFYSIILIGVYTTTYYLKRNRGYLYLVLCALYSILASLAYTLNNDFKFRIIIFALLNLAAFSISDFTKDLNKYIAVASRVTNYILDFVIFIIVSSLIYDLNTPGDKLIAIAAVLIPNIFYAISYFKLKTQIDSYLTVITIPLKLLLVCLMYNLNTEQTIFLFGLLILCYLASQYVIKNLGLNSVTEVIKWILSVLLVLACIVYTLFGEESYLINITLLILTAVNTIPYIVSKVKTKLAIGINFLIPTVYIIYFTSISSMRGEYANELHTISIVMLVFSVLLHSYLHIKNGIFKYTFAGFLIINFILTFLFGFFISVEKFLLSTLFLSIAGYIIKEISAKRIDREESTIYLFGLISSQFLNVTSILTALLFLDEVSTSQTRLIASLSIAILPILNVIKILEGRYNKESMLVLCLIPLQILVFGLINDFTLENMIITFTLYSIAKVAASELYNKRGQSAHHFISQIIFWVILLFTTILTSTAVINELDIQISAFTIVFVYITNLLLFNLPAIIYKRSEMLMVTSNYLILTVFRIANLILQPTNTLAYLIIAIVLHFFGIAAHFFINQKEALKKTNTFIPFICLSGLALIFTIINTNNLYSSIVFALLALSATILSNFHKRDEIKYISVISVFMTTNFLIGYLYEITRSIELATPQMLNTLAIIPAIFYIFNFEINYGEKKVIKSDILGIIIFSVYAALITVDYYRVIVLAILLAYSIYTYTKYKLNFLPYIIFFLTNWIFVVFAGIQNYKAEGFMLGYAAIAFIFASLHKIRNNENTAKLSLIGAITLAVIALVNTYNTTEGFSYKIILTSLIATAGLVLSDKLNFWFGNIAGFAFTTVLWNIGIKYQLSEQYYVFTVFLYLIFLAIRYYRIKNIQAATILEIGAYIIQSYALLQDSIIGKDSERILYGLILIVFSSAIAFMGAYRKNKPILITGISFLILELIARLYVVIVSLDWWVYLLGIGIIMISGAIYLFIKSGEKQN